MSRKKSDSTAESILNLVAVQAVLRLDWYDTEQVLQTASHMLNTHQSDPSSDPSSTHQDMEVPAAPCGPLFTAAALLQEMQSRFGPGSAGTSTADGKPGARAGRRDDPCRSDLKEEASGYSQSQEDRRKVSDDLLEEDGGKASSSITKVTHKNPQVWLPRTDTVPEEQPTSPSPKETTSPSRVVERQNQETASPIQAMKRKLQALKVENARLKERQTCCHCRSKPVNLTLLPCGHFCLCAECGATFSTCPLCSRAVLADVRTTVVQAIEDTPGDA